MCSVFDAFGCLWCFEEIQEGSVSYSCRVAL